MKKGMREFRQYRRKQIAELRPYQTGEDIGGVSISEADKEAGSPKAGDMIAIAPKFQGYLPDYHKASTAHTKVLLPIRRLSSAR